MKPGVRSITIALGCVLLCATTGARSQQVADTEFRPRVSPAAFEVGKGPRVAIDAGHFNFHTVADRFAPFAGLLMRDGFVVETLSGEFSRSALSGIKVLVIANALNKSNVEAWALPTPTAFTLKEMEAIKDWVNDGGALLLIADHMPFGGAAADLASQFGFSFTNGYARRPGPAGGILLFSRSDDSLRDHPIVRGRNSEEPIRGVRTFLGQAFGGTNAQPILVLPTDTTLAMPATAGEITSQTPTTPAGGMFQGATIEFGKGRVAAFGEAAMFTAQLVGPDRVPIGINSPDAKQNAQFALNVVRWLAGSVLD
jgi:hypothetical protein